MTARPYKVICISLYDEDIEALDAAVAQQKAAGVVRADRSMLIRAALAGLYGHQVMGPVTTMFRSLDGSRTRFTVTSDARDTVDIDEEK